MHRHENCQPYYSTTRFVSGDLPLALLSTCRQIHLEAAAFPFKSNVFTCADGEGFKELLKWLSAAQKASISEIVFEGMLHPRNYIPWIASLKELRGLRSLTIFTWVYRWPSTAAQVLHLAQIAFQRAFPPTERSRSDTFTSVNFCFEELSRGLKGGADNEAIANFRDEVEELLKGG